MPANQKYLSTGWQSFLRISAGLLGGYFVTVFLQLAIGVWTVLPPTLITSTFSSFIIWVVLMCIPFWIKNPWISWGIYSILILLFYSLTVWGKSAI